MKRLAVFLLGLVVVLVAAGVLYNRSLRPDPLPRYIIEDRGDGEWNSIHFATGAGDFDRDGVEDVLTIESIGPDRPHELRIYSGARRRRIFTAPIEIRGPSSSATMCGDIDDDGTPDILVGLPAWDHAPTEFGRVQLISGTDGAPLATLQGTSPGDLFGAHVCALGDVDDDGVDDFAVAAPRFEPTEDVRHDWHGCRGYVQTYSGRAHVVIARAEGATHKSFLGGSLVCVGDVDGDGANDLAAYSREGDAVGGVRILSGRSLASIRVVRGDSRGFDIDESQAQFFPLGERIAALGDVDLDGVPDFAASAETCALVISGHDGSLIQRIPAPHELPAVMFSNFGEVLACAGDVDSDGRPDLVIATPGWEYDWHPHSFAGGRVGVYSAWSGEQLLDLQDRHGLESLGSSVASLGDLDGDGSVELLVSTCDELRIYGTR